MGDLSKFKFKRVYDPCADGSKLVDDFYIPCLANSVKYDRCSAYFSAASLECVSMGLEKFVKQNNGKIRFIFSCQIDEKEMDAIIQGYKLKMDELAEDINVDELDSFQLSNLSYLIAAGVAEVKIAFMLKNKGSLMHAKFGLFTDEHGYKICFSGSGNETRQGFLDNAEFIKVTLPKNEDYIVDIGNVEDLFERMWNNTYSPSTIRAEYPTGKLFEKLLAFNKKRMFDNETEFYVFNNCVLIDIDFAQSKVILHDYTKEKYLSNFSIVATLFPDSWEKEGDDRYSISNPTMNQIRNMLLVQLKEYNIKYILLPSVKSFLEKYELQYAKRTKLALAIKNGDSQELWLEKYNDFKNIVDSEMSARLKDEQMKNAFFHYCMKSSADFSVPGTGKTYISYGLYAYLSSKKANKVINKLVVFGPKNCFKAWKDEGKAIFENKRDTLTFFDINEHHQDFANSLKNEKYDVYLWNYEYISSDKLEIMAKYLLDSRTLVIFDEIHKLKNPNGKRALLFLNLFEKTLNKPIYQLALTGTPIPNSFKDLYNYVKILYPEDIGGVFSNLSINKLEQADSQPTVEKETVDCMQSIFVRTTKADLAIPPAEPDDKLSLCVNASDVESQLLRAVVKTYSNPLEKYIRLIQASSNPELLLYDLDINDFSEMYDEDSEDEARAIQNINGKAIYKDEIINLVKLCRNSSKFLRTVEKIIDITKRGQKVIVWCLFIKTIDKLKEYLLSNNVSAMSITGRDEALERERLIDLFKNGPCQVLVTNPNTLAESISLHKTCHHAIYLEFGFNLTYLLQSKDRIHRVGLKEGEKTYYYFAITKDGNSVDTYIYNRLEMKAERMKRAIESRSLVLLKSESDIQDILEIVNSL